MNPLLGSALNTGAVEMSGLLWWGGAAGLLGLGREEVGAGRMGGKQQSVVLPECCRCRVLLVLIFFLQQCLKIDSHVPAKSLLQREFAASECLLCMHLFSCSSKGWWG